jgi:proton-coupled amino acid transporter
MHGNWHMFQPFLHGAILLMCFIILVVAVLGYLSFGPDTNQLILLNLPAGEPLTIVTNLLLIVGVACTYPLQIIPVVQIMENALFGESMTLPSPK